jgi:hypothetical protein
MADTYIDGGLEDVSNTRNVAAALALSQAVASTPVAKTAARWSLF